MRSISFDVTREFHEKAGFTFPHYVTTELGNYTKSSKNFVQSLTHENQELARSVKKITFMDRKTRKVVEVPKYLRENFKSGRKDIAFPLVDVSEPPMSCFVTKRKVQYSDLDLLQHVNSCIYIDWCMDAACEAVARQKLANFTHDLAEYRIQKIDMLFMSECFALEEVEVSVWEKEGCKHTLLCEVSKTDADGKKRRVTFCSLTFYPLSFGMPKIASKL